MNNRLDFGKQMDKSKEKDTIAEVCKSNGRKNVLDLGAGTCKISKQIADKGIAVTAVDFHLNEYDIEKTDTVEYVNADLIEYVKTTSKTFDCVVLSGILHELSVEEFEELKHNLHRVLTDDVMIIIREPIYESVNNYYMPFKNVFAMNACCNKIKEFTPKKFQTKFNKTAKLHKAKLPEQIKLLNMAFTYSYGPESWERELAEYRFTYSLEEIINFIKVILKSGNCVVDYTNHFDQGYKNYFTACGYPEDLLDSINYTNTTIIVASKK